MLSHLYRFVLEAEGKRQAVAHFNISDLAGLNGIASALRRIVREYHVNLPVIIGVSEGEMDYIGIKNAASIVKNLNTDGFNVYMSADHVHSVERLVEVVRAGFDAAVFDMSHLAFEENMRVTATAVKTVKQMNPLFVIEGEIGHIGGASTLLSEFPKDARPSPEFYSRPEEAYRFAVETKVDLIAPAVGNIHGILKHAPNPVLDIERIHLIRRASPVPLVLHGGSGVRDEEFLRAIHAGISIIHINTELRLAWRKGMEFALSEKKEEIAPYKLYPTVERAIENVAFERLKLFNKLV